MSSYERPLQLPMIFHFLGCKGDRDERRCLLPPLHQPGFDNDLDEIPQSKDQHLY
jgi:hypothetical protein